MNDRILWRDDERMRGLIIEDTLKGGDPFDVGKIANIDRIEFVFDQEFTDTFDTVRRSLFARQKQAFPSFR